MSSCNARAPRAESLAVVLGPVVSDLAVVCVAHCGIVFGGTVSGGDGELCVGSLSCSVWFVVGVRVEDLCVLACENVVCGAVRGCWALLRRMEAYTFEK